MDDEPTLGPDALQSRAIEDAAALLLTEAYWDRPPPTVGEEFLLCADPASGAPTMATVAAIEGGTMRLNVRLPVIEERVVIDIEPCPHERSPDDISDDT